MVFNWKKNLEINSSTSLCQHSSNDVKHKFKHYNLYQKANTTNYTKTLLLGEIIATPQLDAAAPYNNNCGLERVSLLISYNTAAITQTYTRTFLKLPNFLSDAFE